MERMAAFLSLIFRSKSTKCTIALLAAMFLIRKVKERKTKKMIQSSNDARIAVVVKERNESVEWARKESQLVDEEQRRKIEEMTFKQLQGALQSGIVTAEAVIRTYFGLAVKAHEKTNCLTDEALAKARQMDVEANEPGFKKPPLWGIPLSVKDAVEVKGHRCTWGRVSKIDCVPTEDSYPIMKLREDGMIPFVKTNVPTTCMAYTCDNSLFGTTCNPHNATRTSGGSSGGEGALISSFGSLIGLGSDIAGSIRIPSAYSGCCGFKPSATRFSTLQIREPIPNRPILMPTEGPLAQDPHAIVEIMRSVWSDLFISNHDPLSVPVDFREDLFKEGTIYRIGYYNSDGYIDPLPGNQSVIGETVELLRAKGHKLVSFSLDDIASEMAKGVFCTAYADGGAKMTAILSDEPMGPIMEAIKAFGKMPFFVKTARTWLAKLRGDKNTVDFFLSQSNRASDVQAAIDRVYATRKRLIQKMKDERVDLILCPTMLSPALPHALPNALPKYTSMMLTMLWNAMDFPAGVVTIGKWNENDEKELESYPEKGLVERAIKKGCRNSIGLPLSVQLIAPPFRDESVLRAMVDLYDSMQNHSVNQ